MSKKEFSNHKKKIKNDIILVTAIILVAVAGLFLLKGTEEKGNTVTVLYDGKEIASYSISQDIEKEIITGSDDEWINTLVIKDGEVFVKSANCPDGICVDHRPVKHAGETIICLPHKVVVEIK